MMKANISTATAALLLAALIAGCGSDEDSADTSAAASRTEPVSDVKQTADDAADSGDESGDENGEESAEAAGDAMEDAGEDSAQMASESGDQTEEAMADSTGAMDDGAAASGDSGDSCVVDVEVGDSIAYSVDSISVPSSCESVTINLAHTGSLPKEAMGHNWVLVSADAVDAIGQAGMSAGPENGYLPDDDRIVAATDIIGGGESTSVTFSLDDLEDGVDYAYVCTFPGHWSVMRGPFTVE